MQLFKILMDTIKAIIAKIPKKDISYLVVIAILAILFLRGCSYEDSLKEEITTARQIEATSIPLVAFKGKDSLWRAERESLVGEINTIKREYNRKIEFQSAELNRLMAMVDKRTKSAVVMNSQTKFDTIIKTEISFDTIHHYDSLIINKQYIVKQQNEWIDLQVNVSDDSSSIALIVTNAYDIEIEEKRKSIFGPTKTVAHVKNLNPYTQTTELQSFVPVKQKKKYRGLKYGAAILAGFVIAKL
jgi:hypothetical protein